MAKLFQQIRVGTLTDDAVRAKTGKTWDEWCKILDRAGGLMMDHQERALWLREQSGLSNWWGQMIAVGYENERGIRAAQRGELPGHRFEVNLNKTVSAPRSAVWSAFEDKDTLARWLPDAQFAVSKTAPPKILYLTWRDETPLTIHFYERNGRTRLVLAHRKLSEAESYRLREYWSDALDRLRVMMSRPMIDA